MARLVLHDLRGDKRAADLAKLLEELVAERRRAVVWVADEGRRKILDDWLWTFEKTSFVPHELWQPSLGELDEPLVLLGDEGNPNRAEVLVIGDDLPPADWARSFDEVHDFIPPDEAGEERRAWWQRWSEEGEGS
jgi:DNA polymerase-3 subunit chi